MGCEFHGIFRHRLGTVPGCGQKQFAGGRRRIKLDFTVVSPFLPVGDRARWRPRLAVGAPLNFNPFLYALEGWYGVHPPMLSLEHLLDRSFELHTAQWAAGD